LLKARLAVAMALVAGLAGCASQSLDSYSGEAPRLDLRDYFDGPLQASGIFFDYSGTASLRFVVDMDGSWQGDTGILSERFRYSDGRTEKREWTIRFSEADSFTATAHDVVGEATGAQSGNAATMRYRLRIPRGDGDTVVSMEDWFYLQEDGTLINRAKMRKFGLTVGELVVTFRKAPE